MYYALLVAAFLFDGCSAFVCYNTGYRTIIARLQTRCYVDPSSTSTPTPTPTSNSGQKFLPLPTVPSLPLVGSLPFIGLGKATGIGPPPHVQMAQLARIYGDVMKIQMGRDPWVILSSPSAVHEAFVVKGGDFSGRPMVPSMGISSGGGQGFAQPRLTDELKALRRTAFGELFGRVRVERSRSTLEDEALLLAEYLVGETERNTSVEIRPALRKAVTNFVLGYVFSARVPFQHEATGAERGTAREGKRDNKNPPLRLFEELVDVTDQIWAKLTSTQTTMADLLAPPTVTANSSLALRKLVRRRDYLLREIVAHRQQQQHAHSKHPHQPHHPDMLDALLIANLSPSEIHYTLVDLFVAGVNTVATQLEWFLLSLANKPNVQSRARTELHNGDTPLPYTRAVVKEVLRTKPPLLVPRQAVVESSIGGYAVPAGTVVMANNWALTHGEDWWLEPGRFRPERWLEEESGLGGGGAGVDGCKFIPYSIGRRVCPGSRLAEAEMGAATQVLLREVRWTKGSVPIDMREEYSLTLSPTVSQSLCFERVDRGVKHER